jgi:hypothetical protein
MHVSEAPIPKWCAARPAARAPVAFCWKCDSVVDERGAFIEMAFRREKLKQIERMRRYANHD